MTINGIPKEELRNRIARIIAASRFPLVDQNTPDWDDLYTRVNDEKLVKGIETPDGILYPKIVILRHSDGEIHEVGEVEMEDTVNESRVPAWRIMSEVSIKDGPCHKFYLYVPEGTGAKAKKLLEENEISYAGLREWKIENSSLVVLPLVTGVGDDWHVVT